MCLYVSLTAGSAAHRWPEAEKKRGDSFFFSFFFFLADCVTLGIWYSLILLTGTFTSWCACKRTQLICLMRKIVQITSLGLGNWKIMSFLQKNGFSCDLLSYSSLC